MRGLMLYSVALGLVALVACDRFTSKPQQAAGWPGTPVKTPPPTGIALGPPSQVGRFVVVHSPHVESDTILLDTATGQTWQQGQMTAFTGDPLAWVPIPQLNAQADYDALALDHPRKAKLTPVERNPFLTYAKPGRVAAPKP